MKRKIALLTTLLALSGLALTTTVQAQTTPPPATPPATTPTAPPGKGHHEPHPAIHNAIKALEHAKADLQKADHDFGGHREAALKECDEAIRQLKLALQYDKK